MKVLGPWQHGSRRGSGLARCPDRRRCEPPIGPFPIAVPILASLHWRIAPSSRPKQEKRAPNTRCHVLTRWRVLPTQAQTLDRVLPLCVSSYRLVISHPTFLGGLTPGPAGRVRKLRCSLSVLRSGFLFQAMIL